MLNPNAQKWVDALRSGKYVQGHYRLHPTDDTFCCLGVACDLFAKEHPLLGEWRYGNFLTPRDDSRSTLALEVADWLGMRREPGFTYLHNGYARYGNATGQNLVQDNDTRRHTFDEISDIIEAHQEELFNT